MAAERQGRRCAQCHAATVRLLVSPRTGRPAPWLMVLVAACTYVVVRSLEAAAG